MRLYALTELHDPEAIELFITEEDARRALEDCLRDEPQWRDRLGVTEVERDHEHTSLNWLPRVLLRRVSLDPDQGPG